MRSIAAGGRRGPAQIPILIRRIRAHHKEIGTAIQPAVPGARRQHHHVAGANRDFTAVLAAQHQSRLTAGHAQHFMRGRVVVMKAIDAVAPLRRPAILSEDRLKIRCRIPSGTGDCAPIEQRRQVFVVRHPPVFRESKDFRRSRILRRCIGGNSRPYVREVERGDDGMECSTSHRFHGN